MKLGCTRISTNEQSLALQQDTLTINGCAQMFDDRGVSSVAPKRHDLGKDFAASIAADLLVVWTLNRLGHSLPHLIKTVRQFDRLGLPQKPTGYHTAHVCDPFHGRLEAPAGMARLIGIDHSTLLRSLRPKEAHVVGR